MQSHVKRQLTTQRAQLGKLENELWQTEEVEVKTPQAGGDIINQAKEQEQQPLQEQEQPLQQQKKHR